MVEHLLADGLRYTLGTTVFHGGNEVARISIECPLCYEPMEVPILLRSITAVQESFKGSDSIVIGVHVGVDDIVHDCKKDR
jgi:hypothetical protein